MNKIAELIKKNRDDIIRPTAVLLVICIVISAALALANRATAERIAALDAENVQKSMRSLVSAESFTLRKTPDFEYYTAETGGNITAYIFTVSEKGYGGDISVMTAVLPDRTVSGVLILDVSGETPGLGQNAAKEEFYSQFTGLKGGISLLKNGASSEENEVDAVTGATVTSTAVTRAVNKALDNYEIIRYLESTAEVTDDEK